MSCMQAEVDAAIQKLKDLKLEAENLQKVNWELQCANSVANNTRASDMRAIVEQLRTFLASLLDAGI